MKTKAFVPATKLNKRDSKATDYWSMLFISFIFISSISCFLFANHVNKPNTSSASSTSLKISTQIIDADQQRKS
ncbi:MULTISPECIES: hypothetical protein [Marinomonas]|uniref:Uncharacterized protein n=1 Tax=Marinomonas aquiplantarum TaxID=491951 RepID=A0A366D277_9GAMM|nr:hypothetical protein [Marinomonas aquiplantarum]RBO83368.1 hypothetical protein DFP76_104183 [Marinomonas aquiplantarum]